MVYVDGNRLMCSECGDVTVKGCYCELPADEKDVVIVSDNNNGHVQVCAGCEYEGHTAHDVHLVVLFDGDSCWLCDECDTREEE